MVTSFRSYAPSYFKQFYIPNYDKWNSLILCWAGTYGFYNRFLWARNGYSFYPSAGVRRFDIFLYQRWTRLTLNYVSSKSNVMVSCYNDKSFLIKKNFLPTRYYSVDNNRIKPALNP